MIGYKRSIGAPVNDEREIKYALRFDLGHRHMWRFLNKPLLDQLDRCADDSARRIILGISEKESA